ncbi:hypothetical protein VTN96DRAFT_971 [Rasamsonia emersonii]|uniref:Uncharacterized protein n=1 Tax=Rasamsonia emersonii (strain ATCC 16479 / CBS 393.64 / IMI 116815) TaxID=1408163 RepID=A0A0F4YQN6_RASE3|nr:hypothetical protein T310_5413 [Rasamsonia emersonii CBS 393.64]KKA20569.1 hypothetical protein T310_5413 [Rasamsonia emersonii CBS 393.64]
MCQHDTPRLRLDTLWEEVVHERDIALLREDEVTDEALKKHQIQRIQCDFERLDDERANLSLKPPILFHPPPAEVLERHPVDVEAIGNAREQEEHMQFRDYNPPTDPEEFDRGYWTPVHCAREVSQYLKALVFGFPRIDVPQTLVEKCKMTSVSLPNPLLSVIRGLDGYIPEHHKQYWATTLVLEYEMENDMLVHPHVILMTVQSCNGKDGSMLLGVLAPIIAAMRNRANQPKVDEDGEELLPRQLEFEKEERFPVLMVSLLGPQHGRLFYVCMDGGNLMIRQSDLFLVLKERTARPGTYSCE